MENNFEQNFNELLNLTKDGKKFKETLEKLDLDKKAEKYILKQIKQKDKELNKIGKKLEKAVRNKDLKTIKNLYYSADEKISKYTKSTLKFIYKERNFDFDKNIDNINFNLIGSGYLEKGNISIQDLFVYNYYGKNRLGRWENKDSDYTKELIELRKNFLKQNKNNLEKKEELIQNILNPQQKKTENKLSIETVQRNIKNDLQEGKIYKIEIGTKNEESTYAYFEIKKDSNGILRLKPFSTDKFNTNSFKDAKINVKIFDNMKLEDFEKLNDKEITKLLFNYHKKNKTEHNAEEFKNIYDIKKEDVTTKVKKELTQKETKTLTQTNNKTNQDEKSVIVTKYNINSVPKEIQDIRENQKLKPLTTEQYTQDIFKMLVAYHSIKDMDRNLSNNDKKILNPILKMFNNKESLKEKEKVFNEFIFNNENNKLLMEKLGIIFSKTQKPQFKGYEKKHSNKTKNDRELLLEAIKNNKLPIMTQHDKINYVLNPINNSLYKGYDQLLLQTNNAIKNINETSYIPINQLYKNGGVLNPEMRIKAQIIENGLNNNGQKVYTIVVPCSSTYKLNRQQRKMIKEIRKEEYRRNIYDAKFLKKYGQLPIFTSSLTLNDSQNAAIPRNFKINPEILNKKDIKDLSIEELVKHDIKNMFVCSLTKQTYVPSVDYTKEPYKKMLEKYVSENPEGIKKISNEVYKEIQTQLNNELTKQNLNQNQQTQINQNINSNENQNINNSGRKR